MRALGIGGLAVLLGVLTGSPANGAVKIQLIAGRPVVDGVYVNGHGPYRFLVDTGTTLNHIDRKLARSLGLEATLRTELLSSSGATTVSGVEGVEVAIDSVRADGQVFLFAGMDAVHERFPRVQGVLGEIFLSRFDYLLDLRGKRMEFGSREPQAGKSRASFQTVAGRPVISTSLGPLVLDSGTNWVTLFGVSPPALTHQMLTMTGLMRVGTVSSTLEIDGRTFWRGDAVAIPPSRETGAVGLLPVRLFQSVYVCNSGGFLVLE